MSEKGSGAPAAGRARVLWLWLAAEIEAECMPLWGDEEIGHA